MALPHYPPPDRPAVFDCLDRIPLGDNGILFVNRVLRTFSWELHYHINGKVIMAIGDGGILYRNWALNAGLKRWESFRDEIEKNLAQKNAH